MEDGDLALRNTTYGLVTELGRAPTAAEAAEAAGLGSEAVLAGWGRLHAEHALVLNDAGTQLRMLNPFAAAPTAYRVRAGGRWWYGNCAWDAIGICAALHSDGHIECSCPDCGEPIALDIRDGTPSDETLLFHCLVPAAEWWEDIAFT